MDQVYSTRYVLGCNCPQLNSPGDANKIFPIMVKFLYLYTVDCFALVNITLSHSFDKWVNK